MGLDATAYKTKCPDTDPYGYAGDVVFKDEIAYLSLSRNPEMYRIIKENATRQCTEYTGCATYEFNMISIARIQESYYTTQEHEVNDFLDTIIRTGLQTVFIKIV